MQTVRRSSLAGLLVVIALLLGVITPGVAQAASDYDGLLHTSPTLSVYTDGATKSQTMDISSSWYNDLGQAYAKRVSQNIGWPTNLMTTLDDIRSTGGSIGVVMQNTPDGNIIQVIGSHDPNASCGFVGDASTGSFQCSSNTGYDFVVVSYFTYNTYGGNGCGMYTYVCSNDGMAMYQAPVVQSWPGTWSVPVSSLAQYTFYYLHFNTTYPQGYAGTVIPTTEPRAKYVAMGDSFSSGEGNPPFETGTDSFDKCHRSSVAYPRLLQNDASLNLGTTAFVACSSATTSNVLNGGSADGAWGESPQIDALSSDTQVVTITIGGNDSGFKEFATACVLPLGTAACDSSTSIYATTMDKVTNVLPGALKNAYEQILKDAPNAKVYVLDYPQIAPVRSATDPKQDGCFYLYNGQTPWANGQAARDVVNAIDATISNEVTAVQQENGDYAYRLHYVSSNVAPSAFVGHTVCDTGTSYFQNIDQAGNNSAYVFHPNANGQLAYANLISYAVTGGIG